MNSQQQFSFRRSALHAVVAAAVLLVGTTAGTPSDAATATDNLAVTAVITANCTITTTPVAFGAYDPVTANASVALDATGTVTTTCTNGAPVVITLGVGANAAAGSTSEAPARQMSNGATGFLAYSLFSDAAGGTVWGDTEGTGVPAEGTGTPNSLTVYGRIPAGQNLPTGDYSDTVVATVTF